MILFYLINKFLSFRCNIPVFFSKFIHIKYTKYHDTFLAYLFYCLFNFFFTWLCGQNNYLWLEWRKRFHKLAICFAPNLNKCYLLSLFKWKNRIVFDKSNCLSIKFFFQCTRMLIMEILGFTW